MIASAVCAMALAAPPPKAVTTPKAPSSTARSFMVAGYLPSWRFDQVAPDKLKGVTDVMFFSVQPTEKGEVDFGDLNIQGIKKYRESKNRVGYKMWISVGGWGRSAGFAGASRTPETRKKFLEELSFLMQNEGFDGVQFDWQQPKGTQEISDFAVLMSEARRYFAPRKKMIGATLSPWVDMPTTVYRDLDRVFLVSYDNQGQHSTVEKAQKDIDGQIRRGAPVGKVVLGVPFYGRSLTDWSQLKGFGEINRLYSPTRDQDEAGGFWFNSAATMERKVAIAKERGLAGVLVWELGQDASGEASLLKAIISASKLSTEADINPRPTPIQAGRLPKSPAMAASKNEKTNKRSIKAVRPAPKPGPSKKPAATKVLPSRGNTSVSKSAQTVRPLRAVAPKSKPIAKRIR